MSENLFKRIKQAINRALKQLETEEQQQVRAIKEVDAWDGAASNYADTDAYCAACLIDVNPAGDDKKQTLCMLPVRGPGDSAETYVDKAVMAAAGGHGITQVKKPEGVDQGEWDSALASAANKLISAYEQMDKQAPDAVYSLAGKKPPEERALSVGNMITQAYQVLEGMEDGAEYWINDLYFDNSGVPFIVMSREGRLYRAQVEIGEGGVTLGAITEVTIDFPAKTGQAEEEPAEETPTEETPEEEPAIEAEPTIEESRLTIIRQTSDGKFRWFGISCSSVLNKCGSFDTRALFDSFVENFEKGNEEVIRQFYHQGQGFRTGVMDFVVRDGNVLITSGLYDDSELAQREIAARKKSPDRWGDSIGFLPLESELVDIGDGIEIPAYTSGILREVSTLPKGDAASHYTAQTVTEVKRMLQGRQLEAFIELFGDEKAALRWLEENATKTNRAIDDGGLLTRTQSEPATPTDRPEQQAEIVLTDDIAAALVHMVTSDEQIVRMRSGIDQVNQNLASLQKILEGLVSANKQVESRLAAIEKSDDEKRQAWLEDMPKPKQVTVTYRPRDVNGKTASEPVEERGQLALEKIPSYQTRK